MKLLEQFSVGKTAEFLVEFIREQCDNAGFSKLVVGLSGGVDSSVVAALAVRAVGRDRVFGFILPYATSNPINIVDAKELADQLGISVSRIEITVQIDTYFSQFPDASVLRRGNKMARERMSILFDQAKVHDALVIGTSNKTEILLGYGTLFGDGAWSFCPIADLYKQHIFALGEYLGLPETLLTKAPSADLWEGQTDEGELGFTYADADQILFALVDEKKSVEAVVALGFSLEVVEQVQQLVAANRFKSVPAPVASLSGIFY